MAIKKWIGGTTNSLATTSNYAPSGVPVTGDDLYIEGQSTDYDITAGLDTFASVSLASINIAMTYTGKIGAASTGTNSTTTGYMSLGGTNSTAITANIGYAIGGTSAGQGGSLWRLNFGSSLATINVTNTCQSSSIVGAGPVTILGTHTNNTMNILAGTVSVAVDPTETSKFLTINNRGNLVLGTGVTLTTVTNNGGTARVASGLTTFTQSAGSSTFVGSGTVSALTLQGGSAALNSTGTITALNVYGANAVLANNPAPRTVTTVTLYAGATLNLNNGVKNSITITNPIVTNCGPGQFSIIGWFGSSYVLS